MFDDFDGPAFEDAVDQADGAYPDEQRVRAIADEAARQGDDGTYDAAINALEGDAFSMRCFLQAYDAGEVRS
jgi:hypothetical protein